MPDDRSARIPADQALGPAHDSWDLLVPEVTPSLRPGTAGRLATRTKQAAALAVTPVRALLLGPQRAFNRRLLEELTRAIGEPALSRGGGLEDRLRATERIPSFLAPVLERQLRWNRVATRLALQPESTEGIHQRLGELLELGRVPALEDVEGVERIAFPVWIEPFRRQARFNASITATLAALHGLPRRAEKGTGYFSETAAAAPKKGPLVSLVTPTWKAERWWLEECVASVLAQTYSNWELCLVDDGSPDEDTRKFVESLGARDPRIRVRCNPTQKGIALATNDALAMAKGEFVAFLDHDDTLAPNALAEVVRHLEAHPRTDFLYTDEDRLDLSGARTRPFFKPDWSPDLLHAVNYACHFLVARRSLVDEVGRLREGFDGAQDYDLILRLSEQAREVGHVAQVLYHWRQTPSSTSAEIANKPAAAGNGLRALEQHLRRIGEKAQVTSPLPTNYRVRHPLPSGIRIQLVVAGTKNLQTLLDGLTARNQRDRLCVVSTEPVRGVRHLPWDGAIDLGAMYERARGELAADVFVFLHSDLKIVDPEWLGELVSQAARREIGVVGPKVLYPDLTIEDAGTLANGARPFDEMADLGDWTTHGLADWTRNCVSVSPQCFAVRAEVLERIGGFKAGLPADQVVKDLCARAIEAGLRVLYTPHARVVHAGRCGQAVTDRPPE